MLMPVLKPIALRYGALHRPAQRCLIVGMLCALLGLTGGFLFDVASMPSDVAWALACTGLFGEVLAVGVLIGLSHVHAEIEAMVEDRLRFERSQWARQLVQLRDSDARQMEQWQGDKVTEIYRMVVDQMDRGEVTCSKCAGIDEAHCSGDDEE